MSEPEIILSVTLPTGDAATFIEGEFGLWESDQYENSNGSFVLGVKSRTGLVRVADPPPAWLICGATLKCRTPTGVQDALIVSVSERRSYPHFTPTWHAHLASVGGPRGTE